MNNFPDIEDDFFTGKEHTPLRDDAFDKSPEEKIEKIQGLFQEIMETLGLDLTDDSLKDSPKELQRCMSMKFSEDYFQRISLLFLHSKMSINTVRCL